MIGTDGKEQLGKYGLVAWHDDDEWSYVLNKSLVKISLFLLMTNPLVCVYRLSLIMHSPNPSISDMMWHNVDFLGYSWSEFIDCSSYWPVVMPNLTNPVKPYYLYITGEKIHGSINFPEEEGKLVVLFWILSQDATGSQFSIGLVWFDFVVYYSILTPVDYLMDSETGVQFLPKTKKWYLITPCLILNIMRYVTPVMKN